MIPVLIGNAKNSITYNGLNINNPADDEKDTYVIEDVSVSPAWQQVTEPYPDRDGSQTLEPYELSKIFRIRGWVRGSTSGKLYDKIQAINRAFHPRFAYDGDAGTYNRGYKALTFNVPTDDTVNYPSGLIACQYFVQAIRPPVSVYTKWIGHDARIDFLVLAADPRRYLQTSSSGNRTDNGTIVMSNTLADWGSYPIITIVTTTAPSGSPTIARTTPAGGVVTFTGASLAGATTYILDMQARSFKTSGGTDKISAISGGSQFSLMAPQVSNTWTIAGWPADVSVTITWVRAFV